MEVKKQKIGQVWIMSPEGKLDGVNSPAFMASVTNPLLKANYLLLDFSAVVYASSAGLRAILQIEQALKKKRGKLLLTKVPPQVLEVLQISKVDSLLEIVDDQATALASLQQMAAAK